MNVRRIVAALALVAIAANASAQDRPAVFLHGLGAEASDWAATSARLRNLVAIDPKLPPLNWKKPYDTQAVELQARADIQSLPASTVALGHSNGGVVAREWSRFRPLEGVVTIGTPHRGAPFVGNFLAWRSFHNRTPSELNRFLAAFSRITNYTWVAGYFQHALGWVSDLSIWSVASFLSGAVIDLTVPVIPQMVPDSPYLTGLNSASNLNREAAAIRGRVGIVSIARNFYFAGPARAVMPDNADTIAYVLYGLAAGMEFWGSYVLATADPADFGSLEQGLSLLSLAHHLLSIDAVYCRLVSTKDASACIPNDGIVPITSQEFPEAPNLLIGTNNDGPAHTQEKDWSDDALYHALTWYLRVAPRNGPTPPPPGPEPPPNPNPSPVPPDEEDGGIGSSGPDVMIPGQEIHPGQHVHSENGRYHLSYQGDGNLVLYDEHWQPLWASGTTWGGDAGVAAMQGDGNLVVYNIHGQPLWGSGTDGNPGAFLVVQNDGNLVIYSSERQPLWSTGTAR